MSSPVNFGLDQLTALRKAVFYVSQVGYDVEDDIERWEEWLDKIAAALADILGQDEPETIDELFEIISGVEKCEALSKAQEDVYALLEYASCISYGLVALTKKQIKDAASKFESVSSAAEEVYEAFAANWTNKT